MSKERIKRCTLEGASLENLQAVYESLSKQLDFPAHFGNNLDALWDVLSTDIRGPFEIVWRDSANSEFALESDFRRLIELFDALRDEREDFTYVLD